MKTSQPMIDADELERRAKAATPGPWNAKPRLVAGRECDCEIVGNEKPQYHVNTPVCRLSTGFVWYEGDKQFIETFNPQTILAMLAELRALRNIANAAAEFRTAAAIYRDVGGSVEPMVRAEIALIRCFQSPALSPIQEPKSSPRPTRPESM